MKKSLVFTPDEIGKRRFLHLFDGVVLGGSQGQKLSKVDLQREAELQVELEGISDALSEKEIDLRFRPLNARVLKPEGGTITLKDSEITLAVKLLEAVPWGGFQKVAVADLYSFLDKAPNAVDEDPERS